MASQDQAVPVLVPFEIKGGSPFTYRVKLPDGRDFDVIVSPNLLQIYFMQGMPNPGNPGLPLFRMDVQLNAVTKAIEP